MKPQIYISLLNMFKYFRNRPNHLKMYKNDTVQTVTDFKIYWLKYAGLYNDVSWLWIGTLFAKCPSPEAGQIEKNIVEIICNHAAWSLFVT